MTKEFKCTALEYCFEIQLGEEKYYIAYEEKDLSWDEGRKWGMERGKESDLPTIEQLLTMYEHKDEINKVLKEAGQEVVGGGLWSNREHSADPRFAWHVNMTNGASYNSTKLNTAYVRAVSAFQLKNLKS